MTDDGLVSLRANPLQRFVVILVERLRTGSTPILRFSSRKDELAHHHQPVMDLTTWLTDFCRFLWNVLRGSAPPFVLLFTHHR